MMQGAIDPELDSIVTEEENKERQPDFQRTLKSVQMPDSIRGNPQFSGILDSNV